MLLTMFTFLEMLIDNLVQFLALVVAGDIYVIDQMCCERKYSKSDTDTLYDTY